MYERGNFGTRSEFCLCDELGDRRLIWSVSPYDSDLAYNFLELGHRIEGERVITKWP